MSSTCDNNPDTPHQCRVCSTPLEEIEKYTIKPGQIEEEFGDMSLAEVFRQLGWPESGSAIPQPSTNASTASKRKATLDELFQREKMRRLNKKGGDGKSSEKKEPPSNE